MPPDISQYRSGNTDIDYVTTIDSGLPGPHVVIMALTHGNEICGAYAMNYLFKNEVRPTHGILTLAFNNVAAFDRFDPAQPFASRFVDEDFNRVWTDEILQSGRDSVELARARKLLPIVRSADFLLDIHSMHLASPPLLMCGMKDKNVKLGVGMGYPAHMVRDWGHTNGRRMRDYNEFDDPASPKLSMLVECGQHWALSSIEVAIQSALRFLRFTGVVDAAWCDARINPAAEEQKLIDVDGPITIKTSNFRFVMEYTGLEVIREKGSVIGHDGGEEVRTPFDDCVLIMPGRNLVPGLSAVRLGRYAPLPG